MQYFIRTHKKKEILDITDTIDELLEKEEIDIGLCTIFVKHTTAAITTADLDPGTDQDMLDAFEAMIPKLQYRHPHNPAHVGDHIMASLIGPSVTIPFINGQLQMGTWQRVVFVELDGPREREVIISVVKTEG
jgi:secondary thiamine-phosphate synthase enzyme